MTARILLRGGCVLTLGRRTPNFPRADVLIEGDRVAEVGTGLRARDAEVVEAAGAVVMPGFVDTHRHAWTSLLRNLDPVAGPTRGAAGEGYDADAVHAATLVGLLGALEAGITTVVDWSDLDPEEGRAEAALQAHADSGLRTVFVLARGASRETLVRLKRAAGPSTTIALGATIGEPGAGPPAEPRALARELGLRLHLHAPRPAPGTIAALAAQGLLGEDVTLVHGGDPGDADLDALAASGAGVSLAPSSEMAGGAGAPPVQRLIDRGIRPGLGVDEERVAPGDLFAQMRAAISWQHAVVFERKLAAKGGCRGSSPPGT